MSRTFDVILKIQHGVSCAMCMGSLELWTFYVISEIRFIVLECQNKLKHTDGELTILPEATEAGIIL